MIRIAFILVFASAYVLSELVPGNNINFITLSGFKYIGEPKKNIALASEKNAEIICSHHCILNKDSSFTCNGYYVDGTTCYLVSDSSKVEKDGVTNNFYQRKTETPISIISPGDTADDDSDEENVVIDGIPNCKQYFETSGSEIILTLPVDPHLPNIVFIKTPLAKAIPADATISSAYGHTVVPYVVDPATPSPNPTVGTKLESSTPLLMSTLRIKIDVTGATEVKINGLGQHGQHLCGNRDFYPAAVETGPLVETNAKCDAVSEIDGSKLKLTLPVDTSLPNVLLFRTTQNKAMPLDPKIISEQYQYTKSNFLSSGGTKLISMTPLSTSEVIITFDITDASETARLNSIKQEGAAENICGGNTFPDSPETDCAVGNGCCDHASGSGTKFVFDLTVDTNLANSFYIRTRDDQPMPDNILVVSDKYDYTVSSYTPAGGPAQSGQKGTLLTSSAPLTSAEVKIVIDISQAQSKVKINGLMQVGADTTFCGEDVAPV